MPVDVESEATDSEITPEDSTTTPDEIAVLDTTESASSTENTDIVTDETTIPESI